jgi:uncharacterized delta-60 repeat protein
VVVVVVTLAACGKVEPKPDAAGAFTVALEPANLFIRRGETKMVAVTVTRDANFTGDVSITGVGLPGGVAAAALDIPEGSTTGMLMLTASGSALEGIAASSVSGSGGGASSAADLRLVVGGPPGAVDLSFAGDGTFTTSVPGMVLISRALTLQTGGGIIVTGSTATQAITARIADNGTLDTTFGGAGFVSTGVGAFSEGIAVTTLADGKVLVAGVAGGPGGASDNDFGIFGYSKDGVLDTTFGASGVAAFDPGVGFGELHTITVAADGSMFVGGTLFPNGAGTLTTRGLRYSATGIRDATYNISETNVVVESSLVQADGKLVMSGALSGDFWLARYNTNGGHDAGFGSAGVVTTNFAPDTTNAFSVISVAGGKLLAVGIGTAGTPPNKHIVLARYNGNGSLDLSFGIGGKVTTGVAFDTRSPSGAILDGTGKILMVGVVGGRPSVARLAPDGTADATFGTAGVATIDFGVAGTTSQTGGYGIAIDADNRIIFAGEVGPAGGQQMAVGRLWP